VRHCSRTRSSLNILLSLDIEVAEKIRSVGKFGMRSGATLWYVGVGLLDPRKIPAV
jgi:hypothetical protein